MIAHPDNPDEMVMTVEEYLAFEATSQVKHKYVDGHVYAMAGGTLDHDRIANNIRAAVDAHLSDGPCTVYGPDVRLRVSPTVYYYPDALVTCDETISGGDIEVATPRLVVEVLSDSTEQNDRGVKFAHYQTIATCQEYLLVDAQQRVVELFRRSGQELWLYQRRTADESITLESIGLTCPLATFYRRTQL
jgi:Uma2 family endonuclease